MSFSTEIKNEVTKLDSTKLELISELSAIVRNSAIIEDSIKITIEMIIDFRKISPCVYSK